MDVYSFKMLNCKQIYPQRIVRPLNKTKVDHDSILNNCISDLLQNSCKIAQYLADNLKRAIGKGCLNHASLFPCEYCFARGVRFVKQSIPDGKNHQLQIALIDEKIEQLGRQNSDELKALKLLRTKLASEGEKNKKKKSHIVWPHSTKEAEVRTTSNITEIVRKIENGANLSPEEKKGVVRRSPLAQIPNFSLVLDVPVDYMHTMCIGVIKRLVELTFNVGEVRIRITKRKLSSPQQFNLLMASTKVPHEFSRRLRELLLSVMKAAEFRNLGLFFFIHILDCIEPSAKERKLWLLLAYMLRACTVPNKEFQPIPLKDIDYCADAFYSLYEALFGATNCTYNTHMVGSHFLEMRYHGPLTSTSTFPFESFYGEMRNCFVPGTKSCLKQIFQKVLLKRSLSNHCCETPIKYTNYDTALESNSMIYCFNDRAYNLYKIVSKNNDTLNCHRIETTPAKFKEVPQTLDWSKVGVFKNANVVNSATIPINVSNVSGKVIKVSDYVITCPNSILREK